MISVRYIGPVPHEVLGALRQPGDVFEVDDQVAGDLLSRPQLFALAEDAHDEEGT